MLLGFVLGTAAAITFSLTGVAVVFLVLRSHHARLAAEFGPLLVHWALFGGLTAIAALSFYAEIKRCAWRPLALCALGAALIGVGGFYWPG